MNLFMIVIAVLVIMDITVVKVVITHAELKNADVKLGQTGQLEHAHQVIAALKQNTLMKVKSLVYTRLFDYFDI